MGTIDILQGDFNLVIRKLKTSAFGIMELGHSTSQIRRGSKNVLYLQILHRKWLTVHCLLGKSWHICVNINYITSIPVLQLTITKLSLWSVMNLSETIQIPHLPNKYFKST